MLDTSYDKPIIAGVEAGLLVSPCSLAQVLAICFEDRKRRGDKAHCSPLKVPEDSIVVSW